MPDVRKVIAMTNYEILASCLAFLALVISGVSLFVTFRYGRDSATSAKKSADASETANAQALAIFKEQKLLAQRQLIIPIWDKISTLSLPDPQNPSPTHMVAGINALELIALCVEGGMVDEAVIVRTFEDRYIQMYDAIAKCGPQPTINNMSGQDLINQNRAAESLYRRFRDARAERDKLKKV